MEGKEVLNGSGVTIKGDGALQSFTVEPRVESSGQFGGSGAPSAPASMVSIATPSTDVVKKKRGRPRKYAGDGPAIALSPMPISASIPLTGDYSTAWKQTVARPVDSIKKKNKMDFESPGRTTAYPVSGGFTPHMITVNTGEDIMMKIISFSQQGSRAICILAANGAISNVTLRQPDSSGGTLTYEGLFEILSLTGSFMPSDNGLTKSRSGGLSVSLAGPDGRVLGGGLAGMLVAAGPVQLVIGSFLPGNQQQEQKGPKKAKYEHNIAFAHPNNPIISEAPRYETATYNTSGGQRPNLTTSTSFHGENSNSMHGFKIIAPESNPHLPGEDRNHELTC